MSKNHIADRADGSENSESKVKTSSVEALCKQLIDRMTPDMIESPLDTYTALHAYLDSNTIVTGQCSSDSSDSADF